MIGPMPLVALLAEVTAVTLLALAGARLTRRSRASVRHVVLAAAFAVLLALPVAALVAPVIAIPIAVPAARGVVLANTDSIVVDASAFATADAAANTAPASFPSRPSMLTVVVGAWAAGAALCLLPVLAGLWQLRSIRRSALPWRRGQTIVDPLALEAGIRRRVVMLLHESVSGPMTCGAIVPALVLPVEAQQWTEADLHRAIVHELEHVRRRDWAIHCLARTVCALYWFHPLVWIGWRQLVLEAERACDDAVLGRAEATAYADQLVGLAERLSGGRHQPLLAMANRADLAARVGAVLDGRQARGRAGAFAVRMAAGIAALLVTTLSPLRIVAISQSPAAGAAAAADGQKFAVISIKPCEGEAPTPPGARSSQGGFPTVSPGTFAIDCGTVERLISNAYVLNGEPLANQAARIGDVEWLKNVPGWLRSEKFTIEAKADGTPDRKVILGPMLRALLEDRFKLKIHRETNEAPLYVLTVAKGGLKLQPMGEDGCTVFDRNNPPSFEEREAAASAKPVCGSMNMRNGPGGGTMWTLGGETMAKFAGTLSAFMDRNVVDKTGVTDTFNIRLTFAIDEHVPGPDKRFGPPAERPPADGPNIFAALEQQLGLKLEPGKGPHGFLVIDHIERPTPNGR
jgi:bla regulator protein BlaR1